MKKILKISLGLIAVLVFGFTPVFKIKASDPVTLISYTLTESTISPNNDGVQDTTSIDIRYSEEVIADINILDAQGNTIKELYHSNAVTNPQAKIWDGKDDSNQIVPNGLYTIQILGTATADATNTISDTTKTIQVDTPVPVTLSSIAITNPADKLEYTVGDSLDISGLEITGTYSDDSTNIETVTMDNITGFDSTEPAVGQVLTITVDSQSTTYTIDINAASEPEEEEEDPPFLIEEDIVLENGCEVVDTDGITHIFPNENSPSEFLGICALVTAQQEGFVDEFEIIDFGWGLFLESINGVATGPNWSPSWSLSHNEEFALVGLTDLAVENGDTITLTFTSFEPFAQYDSIILHITELVSVSNDEEEENNNGGGGGSNDDETTDFDIQKAVDYLKNVQSENGSFDNSLLYTDWAALAYSAANVTGSSRSSLIQYLASHNTISSIVTDNERRAMALLALDQNPYSFHGVNYIDAITESFDGTQLGDINLDNDDIFGLIVLPEVGYTKNDEIVLKTIAFILSAQKSNGSWDNSVDMTAAAIAALEPFDSVTGVSSALSEAADYLESEQESDGGWGNVFSTSWAMQAESLLNASWESESGKTGLDYLSDSQENDGAVSPSSETLANRIWATSYAITAALEKSWSEIMQSVSRPVASGSSNSSSETSENIIDSEALAEPVVCPLGDLFSATTGEACTATLPIESTTPLQENIEVAIIPVSEPASTSNRNISSASENKKVVASSDAPTAVDTVEITPPALTASAINALPENDIPKNLPIVLGTVSGIILLYAAAKFIFLA